MSEDALTPALSLKGEGDLLPLIKAHIRVNGSMNLGTYMALCLGHSQFGYYMTRDPLGADGDFTTAPEVSQMFGEIIGAWLADAWEKLGRPDPFALVECGPGRGTLMEDALRATRGVEGFHQAMRLHLVEMSPVLRAAQDAKLNRYAPVWLDDLGGLPEGMQVLLVGNEFLDALPVRQIIRRGRWRERAVMLSDNDTLCFGEMPVSQNLLDCLSSQILDEEMDGVYEVSPAINGYVKRLSNILLKQGGVALFVDYGHGVSAEGDTFQAVRAHRFESPLENPGNADLTTHVDFENVARVAVRNGVYATPCVPQGVFLKTLGIEMRAQVLRAHADAEQGAAIDVALDRLTGSAQMGELFKVMALCHDDALELAGFE